VIKEKKYNTIDFKYEEERMEVLNENRKSCEKIWIYDSDCRVDELYDERK
jgi:hypothetical protein